jgi:CxxC motif-containing protein
MMKRELTCVACPMGCSITVELENDEVVSVTGNTCKRGEAYARQECVHPTRSLTTTVKLKGGEFPVVSVKSDQPIPKEKMFDVMDAINSTVIEAPVEIGDIVIKDVCGLEDVNIVVTSEIRRV